MTFFFAYLATDSIERVLLEINYGFDRYVSKYEFEAPEDLEYEDD